MTETEIWEMINSYLSNKCILFPPGSGGTTLLARRLQESEVAFRILTDAHQDYLIVLDSDPADIEAENEKADHIIAAAVAAFGSRTTEDEGE